jgi:soluble lytic murein transglycosylase-like protein
MKSLALLACIVMSVGSTKSTTSLSDVRTAIEQVESGGDANAVGDNGLAVGILQIHPTMVEDVNRILGDTVFTLADRLDVERSREMFAVYSNHYTPCGDAEKVARRWNGGPRGDKKRATVKYWRKVSKALEGGVK